MTNKEKTNLQRKYATESLLNSLKNNNKFDRKNLLTNSEKEYIEKCKASKITLTDKNQAKSYVGTVLNEMLTRKDLTVKDGLISLKEKASIVVEKNRCNQLVIELLKLKPSKKDVVFNYVIKKMGADKTDTDADDKKIKAIVGQILSEMVNNRSLISKEGIYSFAEQESIKKYSATPIDEKTFKTLFLERIHNNGGAFFEKFTANVFEKYFLITGRDVLECDVIGGCQDGGIDIKIKTEDNFGFIENYVIQTKCRSNSSVTETEVRSFYGAMHVVGGSRGIFVTTSDFHQNAMKLLDSLDNCVGINGNKLFEIAKLTLYGMKKNKNGFIFDDVVFDV